MEATVVPSSHSHPAQPSRDSIISAQHSLEGAIASPKTKKVLENGLVKNNGRKMESSSPQPGSIRTPTSPFHVRNIEAEAIADRSSSAPGTPQNTLPAVQDFLQMAFDTVQRTKHSQPSSAPATDRPSLLGPFPSTEKPTNHTASATNTPFKKLTAKRTGTSKSLEQTSSPEARRPSTSQGISRSQSYPGYIFYNTSLQNKQATPPKRSILVAKRRNPVSKAAADTGNSGEKSAEETKAISNTKESTPEKKKPGQKGKQNSSRVAQTFKEFKERGRTDAQNGAGTQQAAAGTQQAATHRNWRRGKQTLLNDDVDPNTRVLVSGFPAYTASSELVRVLSVHGACSVESCRNRLAVVRFERAEDAATARAAAPPVLYGELLELKPYTNARHVDDLYRAYRKVVATQKGEDVTMPNELDLSGDFFQQMEVIERAIRLTEEQQQAVAKLYADLEAVLQTEWPGCVAVPFGSIPAGLGMKSSDADCFVQLPAPERGAAFVARARRLLARYPAVFAQLVAIPRANTPIVKFRHLPSGFHCDVSAKTPLGAQNSRLIKLLLGADPRLPRLALLLKYWARVHALSGTGRLTNYALTMLLVFYLQRPGVGLLPPVARLQRPPARPYVVDHWDAGFAPRLPAPERPPPAADLPLPDLFGGFFDFYAAFDFDELVVCPLLGEPVPKAAFEPGGELPPGLARYVANVRDKLVGPIRHAVPFCVQDPFELSHNVASGVSARLAADFLACARAAAVPAARRAAELPRAALAPRPARAAPASTLQLLPRLRARLPPDWRAALRDVLLHDIFRDMLQLRLQRARDDAQRPRRRAKYECERYTAAAGAPVWRRRRAGAVPPGPPAEAAAALVARQAAVTAEIARGPRAALEFELELWFREEPRHCSLGVKMLHGDVDSFRQLVSFVHTVMVDWCRVLLRPRAPEPDDVARRLAAVSLALDAAPS